MLCVMLCRFWRHHRHHHVFHNPSPFSVIADEPVQCREIWGYIRDNAHCVQVDQLFRAAPLLVIPLLLPVNMDLLFIQ